MATLVRILATGLFSFLLVSLNSQAADKFRVACFNLNNYLTEPSGNRPLKSTASRTKVRECLQMLKADVLALEEMGSTNALLELRDALRIEGMNYPYWDYVQAVDTNI